MSRKLTGFRDFLVKRFDYPVKKPTVYSFSEPVRRTFRSGRGGRLRSSRVVRDRRAHLLRMMIRDEHPPPAGTDSWGAEPLIDVAELASYLGPPVSTVYVWRVHGEGPATYRLRRACLDGRAARSLRPAVI